MTNDATQRTNRRTALEELLRKQKVAIDGIDVYRLQNDIKTRLESYLDNGEGIVDEIANDLSKIARTNELRIQLEKQLCPEGASLAAYRNAIDRMVYYDPRSIAFVNGQTSVLATAAKLATSLLAGRRARWDDVRRRRPRAGATCIPLDLSRDTTSTSTGGTATYCSERYRSKSTTTKYASPLEGSGSVSRNCPNTTPSANTLVFHASC